MRSLSRLLPLALLLLLPACRAADAPPASAPAGFSAEDFARHAKALEKTLPEGFVIVVQPPFVVIGDEGRDAVRAHATNTVKWAVDHLRTQYFKKDPADILDIWLFKDPESYNKYTREIFNDTPTTPFGYYSPEHKSLIMNIRTGGGTLVHEIVHPFMAANFPECPSWFNEGMGSLYEQSGERAGRIVGFTNWRLAGLQPAIKAGKVPSFKALCAMNSDEFYTKDKGTNYSQSRYLLYYLQEKGLLTKFYDDFTANKKDDPTGYKTLQKVLGEEDMDAFKKKWEAYVMKLEFP